MKKKLKKGEKKENVGNKRKQKTTLRGVSKKS